MHDRNLFVAWQTRKDPNLGDIALLTVKGTDGAKTLFTRSSLADHIKMGRHRGEDRALSQQAYNSFTSGPEVS
jgi:hypothetical protein